MQDEFYLMKAIPSCGIFRRGLKEIISPIFPVRASVSTFTFHFKTPSQIPDSVLDLRDSNVDKYKLILTVRVLSTADPPCHILF